MNLDSGRINPKNSKKQINNLSGLFPCFKDRLLNYLLENQDLGLKIPTRKDYDEVINKVKEFFNEENEKLSEINEGKNYFEYGIFGSAVDESKTIKFGLSDIDVIYIEDCDSQLGSLEMKGRIEKLKEFARKKGVPLQIKAYTKENIGHDYFGPDNAFLKEIQRGIENGGPASSGFSDIINKENSRNFINDEYRMFYYFYDKIKELGECLGAVEEILKNKQKKEDISTNEQKSLRTLWDRFKKIIPLLATYIAMVNNNSDIFSKDCNDVLTEFGNSFGADIDELSAILNSINNIGDWFDFLKNGNNENMGGLCILKKIYEVDFSDYMDKIGKILNRESLIKSVILRMRKLIQIFL